MREIEVVAAVMIRGGRVFCARRGDRGEAAGKWEVPGGKIEPGETPEAALAREIREEFGAEIAVGDSILTVRHRYATFSIVLHAYRAVLKAGELIPVEHVDARWLGRGELGSVDWAAADLPIVEKVREFLG
jgi:8-oxo-dGTP diphosphatase